MPVKAEIVLFDTVERELLYPFTQTRSVADIRMGIFTGRERWNHITDGSVNVLTASYLKNNEAVTPGKKLFINAGILPDESFLKDLGTLSFNEAIVHNNNIIAFIGEHAAFDDFSKIESSKFSRVHEYKDNIANIIYPWHLFQNNDAAIRYDFALLTNDRKSQTISATNRLIHPENIFIEENAVVEDVSINASAGPVYIGQHALVMEGSMLRGPIAIGEGAVVKMGSAIYGATTIGPYCQAGGEIKNSIMMGYSNKAHHGYLGDSVIGEWCNLGAGTSNSNIKNNAGNIFKEFNDGTKVNVGLKCGLMMGDYSRTAINTSLNTATFAGVACNIFDNRLTPKHIPGFTWGINERYVFEKAIEHIENWKKLKSKQLTNREIDILKYLYKTKL